MASVLVAGRNGVAAARPARATTMTNFIMGKKLVADSDTKATKRMRKYGGEGITTFTTLWALCRSFYRLMQIYSIWTSYHSLAQMTLRYDLTTMKNGPVPSNDCGDFAPFGGVNGWDRRQEYPACGGPWLSIEGHSPTGYKAIPLLYP